MQLARFPRVRLCHAPTALEPMPNLSRHLGGPQIWIKRDDCTGLATGGNKTRKLEFLMGEALERGADHVVTQGAVQSNHVRQTAAAAARLGLACTGLLEERVATEDEDYLSNGNVALDHLVGAEIDTRPAGTNMQAEIEAVAADLERRGRKPYVIPGGGSNPVGALGYVACARELVGQAEDMDLSIDYLVHATGSTGTQAGLLAGLEGINSGIDVIGVSVRAEREAQIGNVHRLATATAELVGIERPIERGRVMVEDGYVGAGYGRPTPEMIEAVELVARLEGVLLDPVYSGKGMAGLIGMIRQNRFNSSDKVVFLHTGGAVALFAYRKSFADGASAAARPATSTKAPLAANA